MEVLSVEIRRNITEDELKEYAAEVARSIVIRYTINGNSDDRRRDTTPEEADAIQRIIFGALLNIRYGCDISATANAAEFIGMQFLPGAGGSYEEPHANTYDTIYFPRFFLTTRKADGNRRRWCKPSRSASGRALMGPKPKTTTGGKQSMSIGREDYQERKEARIDRMEERAARAQAESTAASHAASEIMRLIPPGQPILVGHHSERHHRRDLDKIDRNMRKSIEASEKSAYYASRAASAANNHAISSDDPDAVEKLEAKLAKLQAAQERDKERNAWYRKHKTMKGCPGITDEEAAEADAQLAEMREGIRRPVPAWQLSNRNGEIKRIKDRLAQLRRVDEMEHTEIEFDGGTIITNEDVNRVQILFDEKPDDATHSKLKRNGFRWSRTEGAWQTQRTPQNLRRACYILGIDPPKPAPAPAAETDDAPDAAPQAEPANTDATGEIQTAADGQALFPLT